MKIYNFAIKMLYPRAGFLTHLLTVECDSDKIGEEVEDVIFAREVAHEYAATFTAGKCCSVELRSN